MVEADISQSDLDPDMKAVLDTIVEELVDEVSLGLCFEIHRACKVGSLFHSGYGEQPADTDYAIIDLPGVDVLGQVPSKKNYECVCPNCQRHLAASRFAPHLEKCMGMGRNSSRIASRRIANNQKHGSDDSGQEDENDNDWNYAPESKRLKRLKKEKSSNSPRNRRLAKLRHAASTNDMASAATEAVSENLEPTPNYETMTLEERKALLLSSCGVISEHTKKMCTRTGKCAQHSDEQRRQVRHLLLRPRAHDMEDMHIDIDTYDDADSQSLRESLHWEASSNSSPADSTSTNNSISALPVPPVTTAAPTSSALANGGGHTKKSGKSGGKSGKFKKQKSGKQSVSSSSSASSNKDQISNSTTTSLFDFN